MKRKLLTLISMMTLVASLTACGNATEDKKNATLDNEPVVETTVTDDEVIENDAKDTADADVENPENSKDTNVETEETFSEEVSTETAASFEVSDVIYPNGSTAVEINYDDFLNYGDYKNTELIIPYYTITNTSDSTYAIKLNNMNQSVEDGYFEPGESIVIPAELFRNENDVATWCNVLNAEELQYNNGVKTKDTNPAQNRVQEMTTITFDESKVLYDGTMSVDVSLPDNAVGDGGDSQYLPCYIIYYDANGNVISSAPSVSDAYNSWNVISYADKTFTYPALYYTTTQEPFVWATADVYYSYTVNAE